MVRLVWRGDLAISHERVLNTVGFRIVYDKKTSATQDSVRYLRSVPSLACRSGIARFRAICVV